MTLLFMKYDNHRKKKEKKVQEEEAGLGEGFCYCYLGIKKIRNYLEVKEKK